MWSPASALTVPARFLAPSPLPAGLPAAGKAVAPILLASRVPLLVSESPVVTQIVTLKTSVKSVPCEPTIQVTVLLAVKLTSVSNLLDTKRRFKTSKGLAEELSALPLVVEAVALLATFISKLVTEVVWLHVPMLAPGAYDAASGVK
jgi:hypothetical protein